MANEVRLIDANTLPYTRVQIFHGMNGDTPLVGGYNAVVMSAAIREAPTIDPESLRPKGQWDWKHRHKGGFHKYTGVDAFGETHTITVDERFECDEPYCPKCGKWNESIYLNYCPNCGAKMEG